MKVLRNHGVWPSSRDMSQAVVQSANADNPQFAAVTVVAPCFRTYGRIQKNHKTTGVHSMSKTAKIMIWSALIKS